MKQMWTTVVLLHILGETSIKFKKVTEERDILLRKEIDMMLGSEIILSDREKEANSIIMNLKHNEVDYGSQYPEYYNFSKHFFEYKDTVKKSKLFKIIQAMPKGTILHAHDAGMLGPDYMVQLTYMKNLYVCLGESSVQFLFAQNLPKEQCSYKWQLMENVRNSSRNIKQFDSELRKYFTIVVDNPKNEYTDVNIVWSKFEKYFTTTRWLLNYKPVWEQYFYDTLKAIRDDNIMYVEFRSFISTLYDLNGEKYNSIESARSYKKVLNQFVRDYPDFFGAKLIFTRSRLVDNNVVKDYLKTALILKTEFPDLFTGLDLVGQEDLGRSISEFFEVLSESANTIDYFFHAGETNWYGTSSDENLFDVVVLGTKRIGHGFALIKHPLLIEKIKERDIALEVNVISNVVLNLIGDVRNHPLAAYLAQNLPVVISSDDPGVWEAEPISHDYFVTFIGVASRHADLRLLKKLALNSIHYSTYHNKDEMLQEFEIRWKNFINKIVANAF